MKYLVLLVFITETVFAGALYPAPRETKTYDIAASDSSVTAKCSSKYVCDGVDDQVQFLAAMNKLISLSRSDLSNRVGGRIYLAAGTYYFSAPVTIGEGTDRYCFSIIGEGPYLPTRIEVADNANCSLFVIGHPTASTQWVDFHNLHLDGNRDNQDVTDYIWDITAINTGTRTITISGDQTTDIATGDIVRVYDNGDNNDYYMVSTVTENGGNTDIVVIEGIPSATVTGSPKLKNFPPIIDTYKWQDSTMSHCFLDAGGGSGLTIRYAWTNMIDRCPIEHCEDAGILVSATEGYTIENLIINDGVFINDISTTDAESDDCIYITSLGTNASAKGIQITNCYSRESRRNFLTVAGNVRGLTVTDNKVFAAGKEADDTYYGMLFKCRYGSYGPYDVTVKNNYIEAHKDLSTNPLLAAFGVRATDAAEALQPDNIVIADNSVSTISTESTKVISVETVLNSSTPRFPNPTTGRYYDKAVDEFTDVAISALGRAGSDVGGGDYRIDVSSNTTGSNYIASIRQPDYLRNFEVIINDNDSGGELDVDVFVYYIDQYGQEKLKTITTNADFTSDVIAAEVKNVRINACTGGEAGDYVSLHYGSKFGLSQPLLHDDPDHNYGVQLGTVEFDASPIIALKKNGTSVLSYYGNQTGTEWAFFIDRDNNSIDFDLNADESARTPISNGDDLVVVYKAAINQKINR